MRKTIAGLMALTGIALAAAPNAASAQTVLSPGYDPDLSYYGPGYTPPPYAAWGPPRAYRSPGVRYYSPPAAYYSAPPAMAYYGAPAASTEIAVPERLPGTCGQFFYWSNGRCVDARNK